MSERTYSDECGMALALDTVGERWALLVVRELLFGPKRFVDLRRGLPHASQNVLSQRLKELESAGVIRRAKLGPPVRAQVYELTPAGEALEPAMVALAQWGARLDIHHGPNMSADSLALLLKALYVPVVEHEVVIALELGEDAFEIRLGSRSISIRRGVALNPDVVLRGSVQTWWNALFGSSDAAAAVEQGAAQIAGDEEAAILFLASFPAPTVLAAGGADGTVDRLTESSPA